MDEASRQKRIEIEAIEDLLNMVDFWASKVHQRASIDNPNGANIAFEYEDGKWRWKAYLSRGSELNSDSLSDSLIDAKLDAQKRLRERRCQE